MGQSLHKIMEKIYDILKKDGEMSMRQLSIKTGSQWITIREALKSLNKFGLVKERWSKENRKVRLVSLK